MEGIAARDGLQGQSEVYLIRRIPSPVFVKSPRLLQLQVGLRHLQNCCRFNTFHVTMQSPYECLDPGWLAFTPSTVNEPGEDR